MEASVAEAVAADAAGTRLRCCVLGAVAPQREHEKHRRHPGPSLCAAAPEGGGRVGAELASFICARAPGEGAARAEDLADARQRLVVALARGSAATR